MFGWFKKQPRARTQSEEIAFEKGRQVADQMLAAVDDFKAQRLDTAAASLETVMRDAFRAGADQQEHPPLIYARAQFDAFLGKLPQIEQSFHKEMHEALAEWAEVADIMEMRDLFEKHINIYSPDLGRSQAPQRGVSST